MKVQSKILIMAGAVVMIGILIFALNPFQAIFSYKLLYLRRAALEISEALERNSPIRVRENFYINNTILKLAINKPREQSLEILLNYTVLVVPYDSPDLYIKGKPGRKFEKFRSVHVYIKDGFLYVDPKPVVGVEEETVYGRKLYKIVVTIVKIIGDLKPGAVLKFNHTEVTLYERFYDYTGEALVYIGGDKAVELKVTSKTMLEVYIVVEYWFSF